MSDIGEPVDPPAPDLNELVRDLQEQLAAKDTELANRAEDRDQLAADHRVWARAWSDVPNAIPTQGPPQESHPAALHVERLARAALTDSIGQVCDGRRLGLEAHVASQIRAVTGDPEWAAVAQALSRLRETDTQMQAPASVVSKTAIAAKRLARIAEKLPDGDDARELMAALQGTRVAPPAHIPDLLFRLAIQAKLSTDDAFEAHAAASDIVKAFAPASP